MIYFFSSIFQKARNILNNIFGALQQMIYIIRQFTYRSNISILLQMSNETEYQLTREVEDVEKGSSWTQLFFTALVLFKST
jgi:hypothetical protein